MAVQAGGHLEATGLTITGVCAVGAEVRGEGSCLSLTDCKLHSLCDEGARALSVGVLVHSSSSAHLSSLSVSGGYVDDVRVDVTAAATLDDCQVSQCQDMCDGSCVHILGSTCHLTSCTLAGSYNGIVVAEAGRSAHACKCQFLRNGDGATVGGRATLIAVSCILTVQVCWIFRM